ncbi:hypothetical protein [Streptomyces sp. NPDC048442]|uniref:hypothetical protein n=1 Tax=Streptomyces sp. NPDC048442 TaxID=3154823 RepID=UPI00343C2B77
MRLRLREDAPGLLTVDRSRPRSTIGRRLYAVAWVNVVLGFIFVPAATANPFCYIPMVCDAKKAIDFVADPIGFILQQIVDANLWFLRKMLELMQNSSKIDLTSPGFLKQYAIIFAAASLITAALWFIAVAKRAVRGVPLMKAMSEAVGFLVLQFVVNALTPGVIGLFLKAVDEVTAVFEPYATANFKPFLENMLKVMAVAPNQGVMQLLIVNLLMVCGALLMWIELLIRGAAIYVGVALGPLVNSGLVDRDLWGKSKKWVGALVALALSKPVLFALLGLGGAIMSDSTGNMEDTTSRVLIGALILLLAVFASATLYKWVPAFGDEMAQLSQDRKTASSAGPMAAVDGPAAHANRAMGSRIQDALVGGKKPGAAKAGASAAKSGGKGPMGTAAAPAAMALAGAKIGADAVTNKVDSSPGMQGADAGSESSGTPGQGGGDGGAGAPTMTRPGGSGSGPTGSAGPGSSRVPRQSPGNGPAGAPSGPSTPAPPAPSAPSPGSNPRRPSPYSGPSPRPSAGSSPPSSPPPSARPGSGPSTIPMPPMRPPGGSSAPRKPSTGKDQ